MRTPRGLAECLNIDDLRALARQRVPSRIYPHLIGGAEDEITLKRNTTAFDDYSLTPRALVDVSNISTTTRLLGQELAWPVYCSPTGSSRLFHRDGELAVARAVAKADTLYGLSMVSTFDLETIAAATSAPKMFQAYIFRDRDITRELVLRCKRAGYRALCLTVDAPARGNCERELRYGLSPHFPISQLASFAARPGWSIAQLMRGRVSIPHVAGYVRKDNFLAHSQFVGEQLDPAPTWEDARQLADIWGGPFAIKGIMRADDAGRAADAGATAIVVSNHGGRQVDGAAPTIEVLSEIVAAVGDRLEVVLDGGIRRGSHVFKALALGARACGVGRAYLFGLAAGGEAGVSRALDILRSELVRCMQLCGTPNLASIDRDLIRHLAIGAGLSDRGIGS